MSRELLGNTVADSSVIPVLVKQQLTMALTCTSLMTKDAVHLPMHLLLITHLLRRNVYSDQEVI